MNARLFKIFLALLVALGFGGCTSNGGSMTPDSAESQMSSPSHAQTLKQRRTVHPDYSILYDFGPSSASKNPVGPLTLGPSGELYGTAVSGNGSVFKFSTGAVQTLYTFAYASGPLTGVVRGSDGTLYGTALGRLTYGECTYACGVIYSLKLTGSTWTYTVLHYFGSTTSDGYHPLSPPLLDGTKLYGTTNAGGNGCTTAYSAGGCGTLYKVNTDGSGYSILYRFKNGPGLYPSGSLTEDSSGNIYGTTNRGGDLYCDPGTSGFASGCGLVYRFAISSGTFTDIHDFTGSSSTTPDGAQPSSGVVLDGAYLYGTTLAGGNAAVSCSPSTPYYHTDPGCGVIFKLPLNPVLPIIVLHSFDQGFNQKIPNPSGLTLGSNGSFYGTLESAGTCCGKVFNITTSGTYTTVHNFTSGSTDGGGPRDQYTPALTIDSSGDLYGATYGGGGCCGVLYEL